LKKELSREGCFEREEMLEQKKHLDELKAYIENIMVHL
jgi:hypothetical protein